LPDARLEAEIRRCQRADRTDVGGVARELRVERRVALRDDLPAAPAIVEAQHRVASDLILEADAARAQDAALAIEVDQIAERDGLDEMLLLVVVEARVARPPFHRQVLQRALPALVADRAVERVRGQQELQ